MDEAIRLLIADDDPDVLESMAYLFRDEGYLVTTATTFAEALACVENETFACVLTDLFDHSPDGPRQLSALCAAAFPTPVGLASAWRLAPETIAQAGCVCFISKPFDVDDLLSTVASQIDHPLSPEQQRQSRIVCAFLYCLSEGDWDGAVSLCSEDVTFIAPASVPGANIVVLGKSAYRAYIEETARQFPEFHIENARIVATPRGLAARFTSRWRQGAPVTLAAGMVMAFDADDHIQQIGIRLNLERLRILQAAR